MQWRWPSHLKAPLCVCVCVAGSRTVDSGVEYPYIWHVNMIAKLHFNNDVVKQNHCALLTIRKYLWFGECKKWTPVIWLHGCDIKNNYYLVYGDGVKAVETKKVPPPNLFS